MSDPILALFLSIPCPDCGAAAGERCRAVFDAPLPDGVDPEDVTDWCARRVEAVLDNRN